MSASSIPLKIKNSNGDLQEFTPAQENYLAYAVGQVLAEASAGDVGDISLTDGNSIGSFTDAYYNEPAGTHPLSNLTTTTTTTTLKQVAGPADESGADFTRPVGYYENGPNPGFYEMVDADLDNLAGRVLGNMAQNNYTGTFKLAKTSPGADYSIFIENAFSDTHGNGTVENYNIYQRVTMPAVDAHRPMAVCYDDNASVAVNLSDVSSLNLYQGQDTVITAAPTSALTSVTGTSLLISGNKTISDASPSSHSLTLNGDVSVVSDSPYANTSMSFDGSGDYISIADHDDFNFGSGDFTVEMWINAATQSTNWPGIFSGSDYNAAGSASLRFDNVGHDNKLFLYTNGLGDPALTTTNTLSHNTWHHIALVRSGTSLSFYVNGTQDGTTTISSGQTFDFSVGEFRIGRGFDVDGGNAYFAGKIADVRAIKGSAVVPTAAPTWSFSEVVSGSNYIVVGSRFDDDNGSGSGSIYVYDSTDLSAAPIKLTAFDGAGGDQFGDQFGTSVVVTNDIIVVGAHRNADAGYNAGAIYVYDLSDLSAQPTKLTAFDANGNEQFGQYLAASSDLIVVGAPIDDDNGAGSGSVYVYDANNLSAQPTKLTAFDGVGDDRFGQAVAVTSDKVIVGSPFDDDNGSSSGSVYVYDATDLSAQPTKLTAVDGAVGDQFGQAVAGSSDHIVIGARYNDDNGMNSGSAYVYDANDLSAQPTKLTAYDGAAHDSFGSALAVIADNIFVGSYQDDDNGSASGSVYVYDANNLSAQPTKLTAFDGATEDYFGHSIAATSNKIIIGAYQDNGQPGAVYVYNASDLSATPTKLIPADGAAGDYFGYSVSAISPVSALNDITVTQSDNVFTVTPGSTATSFTLQFSNGSTIKNVDFAVSTNQRFDGFKEMTDAQIKYTLGQRVKSLRATAGAIGSYQLRSSAQGAPIMPGTWLSAGTATNTRRTLVDVGYTRTRNSSYVRSRVSAYTRDRISTFTRNSVASFARTFTGDYTGEYSRGFTGNYSRDFVGNYSRTRTSTFDGTYTRGRLSTFAADYVRSRVSTYDGTFSRNRISTYSRESTRSRNSAYSQVFSRTRASAFIADYTRARTSTYEGTFARDRISSYVDTYTRTRPSTFAGNFTTTRTSTYDGTFSRVRNSSYTGTYSRDRVSSYAGTYTRERASTYTGEYTRARTSTFDGTFSQLRTSSFSDTYARTRTSTYDGTYARTRTSTYDGTYARTRVSSYVQDYTRTRNSTFSATYTRERTSSYSGEFTRNRTSTFDGTFSRTRNSSYSGTFSRTRVSSYIDTYSRARISTYSGTFARNRISSYSDTYARTRNSIYTGQYTRARTSTFDGTFSRVRNSAYAADYTRTRTSVYGATYSRVRASAYTRTRLTAFTNSYSGTFSRARVSVYTRDRVTNFAGIFARTRTSAYTRGRVSTYSGTYARARTSVYSAAYSRTRVSSYTGTYAGTFSRTRISAYSDTYSRSRNSVYTRTSARTRNSSYSADYTRTRVTDYTRNRVTNFAGVFSRARVSTYARTRTSVYSAAYSRDRVSSYVRATRTANYTGNFVGNYSRNFAGNYSRNFVGNYSRGFAGNFVGNYARVSTIVSSRTRYSAYARTSTRTRASAYTRDRVTNFAGNFVGNYSRNFAGDFVGNYSRTFVGDYTGNYTGNYATTFTGDFVGNYSRAFAGNYAGDYTGNYTTTFTGDFVGNYARNFVGDYVGNFVGNYARAFAGNFAGNYTGNYATTFTGDFVGNYSRGFAGNFAGNYVGEYARTSTRTSTRVLPYTRSLSFTGDFVGNYARNYSANYTRTPAYTRTLYYAGDFV